MKNFALLFVLVAFGFSSSAKAGFLLEPYLGIHVNSTYVNNDCSSNCDGSLSGTALGGRAGFQQLGFMFGVSGKRATFEVEDSTQGDLTTTTLGLFVGYDFPIMLRVWGEYLLTGTGVYTDDASNTQLNAGSGTTLGIGYKAFPFVSLNLEIGSINFNELTSDTVSSQSMNTDFSTYLLSVSIPLSL